LRLSRSSVPREAAAGGLAAEPEFGAARLKPEFGAARLKPEFGAARLKPRLGHRLSLKRPGIGTTIWLASGGAVQGPVAAPRL